MRTLLAALSVCLLAAGKLSDLPARAPVALQGETRHVQGIEVDSGTLWVSSVDTQRKRGLIFEFDAGSGSLRRSVEAQIGERYHPGGISLDGNHLWVPVAEYRRSSSSSIQRRNRKTLALEWEFRVEDHIGAIAVVPEGLVGANWDAREFYVWNKAGKTLRKASNASGVAIQDMKYRNGKLIAGGLRPDRSGVIVWLEWPSLKPMRSVEAGRTDRGVAFTHEGLAVDGRILYLLPEDGPSRLFAFELPEGWE